MLFPSCHWRICFICLWMMSLSLGVSMAAETEIISRIEQIRALSRNEAAERRPLRVSGVVVWVNNAGSGLILHDGSWGIYVDLAMAESKGLWTSGGLDLAEYEPGIYVEMEGVTDPGGYAPVILPSSCKRTGNAPLPEPMHLPTEQLLSGTLDCQSVQVEGVVQKTGEIDGDGVMIFTIRVDGHSCEVIVQRGAELRGMELLDARIRVRGALVPRPNLRAEMTQLRLHVMGAGDLAVVTPAPPPFSGPRVALNRLLPFSAKANPYHRKVTQGIVTFVLPGRFFYIQQGGSGVRVRYAGKPPRIGEVVEVAGFVEISRTLASLDGAVVRVIGPGAMPKVALVKPDQIVHPQYRAPWELVAEKDFSGRLVRVRGRVFQGRAGFPSTDLIATSGGHTFTVTLPPQVTADGDAGEVGLEGAEMDFTGVCELEFTEDAAFEMPVTISGFKLWIRSPADMKLLKAPPWWTPKRLNFALTSTGALIIAALAWIILLRNLLKRRTTHFEQIMRAHRDVELEFSSAQRERLRLAADLHDGIKQRLVAASYRVEAAAGHLPASPVIAARQLKVAHQTLTRTQTELEECLWGLHAVVEGPPDFVSLLQHVTSSAEYWPAGKVTIESVGEPRHFSRNVAGSLLLLFQEAVNNALRHGAATRVEAEVLYGANELELRVTDNGCGFDPRDVPGTRAGHFGIDGMKQRMHWLHGTLTITRTSHGGMEILAKVPWHAIPATDSESAS